MASNVDTTAECLARARHATTLAHATAEAANRAYSAAMSAELKARFAFEAAVDRLVEGYTPTLQEAGASIGDAPVARRPAP